MTAFYRNALGLLFLAAESAEGWAVFDAGGLKLALHAIPPAIAANIEIADPPDARGETPIKLFFKCDDLDTARAHLLSHGAVMFEPKYGRCDGLDPEGNVFSIVG